MTDRYLRQRMLPGIGDAGQAAISRGSVLMVGCGGLASPVLLYLAGAGVGRIGIVDGDRVETTNLHRQILFRNDQTGMLKVDAARQSLLALNPSLQVETFPVFLDDKNAGNLASKFDLLIDGTDQYAAKALLNHIAIRLHKTAIFSGVTAYDAQWLVYPGSSDSPCYQCIYPKAPGPLVQNCEESGVLGPMVGIAGSLQALQALQYLSQAAPPPRDSRFGTFLALDGRNLEWVKRSVEKNRDCPACGEGSMLKSNLGISSDSSILPLSQLLAERDHFALIDVREDEEVRAGPISGAFHVPLSKIEENSRALNRLDLFGLNPGLIPVFFCKSGVRARRALELYRKTGSDPVYYLATRIEELRFHS